MQILRRIAPVAAVSALAGLLLYSAADTEQLWRHRNLGKALYENPTMKQEAVAEFKKALDLAPDSVRENINYGLALLRADRVEEAIPVLLKAQKMDPKLPHTWFNLGVAFKKEREYDKAVEQFEGMLKLIPDEPISHYNLGLMYNQLEKEDLALRHFREAIRLDPKLVAPRAQIFTLYRLSGNEKESEKARDEFLAAKQQQQKWDESEDMDWSWWSEIYDPVPQIAFAPAGAKPDFAPKQTASGVDPQTAGLAVIDADLDNTPELLAWSSKGLALYKGGASPVDAGLPAGAAVRYAAAGDVDNDGYADLALIDEKGASVLRNTKGKFGAPQQVAAGSFRVAAWLDYDHDYDHDLLLFGPKSVLMRNEGEGKWSDRTADFPFVNGESTSAVVFRSVSDTKGMDIAVAYADKPAVLYVDQLRAKYNPVTLDAVPAKTTTLRVVDLDNDGWLDLAFAHSGGTGLMRNQHGKFSYVALPAPGGPGLTIIDVENRGASDLISGGTLFRNAGSAKFEPAGKVPTIPALAAVLESDFDADGLTDLAAVASDGTLLLLRNATKSPNQWYRVALTGVKNMRLAAGTELEVKAGTLYQKKVYEGAPLTFGLGPVKAVDTVRITWPNGLIQNEMNQPAKQLAQYKEAPKLSGSCPMIYTWNGREFEFITDVLGVAPLGASAGDGSYFPVDHDEYIQIGADSLRAVAGRYEVRVTEELAEVTYLDRIRLIAVDHPANTDIFTNDKWKSPPFPEFRLFGVADRIYPLGARDGKGRDQTDRVRRLDRTYPDGFRRNYAGVAETHSLELDFGRNAVEGGVLVLNGWVDWADGSTFLAAAQTGNDLMPPYLQVKDSAGQWRTVIEDLGMPSGKTKTIAVDMTGKWLSPSREVRIVTNLCVYWDEIFLGRDASAPQVRMAEAPRVRADLAYRGFSRPVIHPQRRQPEYFVYSQVSRATSWDPTPGMYTRYGAVGELISGGDDRLLIMGSGDELKLSFDARRLPALPQGWKRDFLLHVEGWAKDRDANTAFSQTVEPLPFRAMTTYPYPAHEAYPAASAEYQRTWNTRPARRLITSLR